MFLLADLAVTFATNSYLNVPSRFKHVAALPGEK